MPSQMFPLSAAPTPRGFVKICGVCSIDDAVLCANFGADAIGILLTKPGSFRQPGSDRLEPAEAANLVRSLPVKLKSVLLVHALQLEEILKLTEEIGPSALQVQKPVDPVVLLRVKKHFPEKSIIKTFSVQSGVSISALEDEIQSYIDHGAIDAVLLDSALGGSGMVHDWKISARLVARFTGTPVILAGGLNAENVADARRIVRPFGMDVMSGVTCVKRRDKKDPYRLRAFLRAWHESSDR